MQPCFPLKLQTPENIKKKHMLLSKKEKENEILIYS